MTTSTTTQQPTHQAGPRSIQGGIPTLTHMVAATARRALCGVDASHQADVNNASDEAPWCPACIAIKRQRGRDWWTTP